MEGEWVAETGSVVVDYGGESAPRELFLTWAQIRETVASGLVEVAAHTMDLHRGIPANPQGNFEPSAVTHRYDRARGYESDDTYRKRIGADTEVIAKTIERELGRRPRAMIWPYGEHSGRTLSIDGYLAMPITMNLIDAPRTTHDLAPVPGHLVNDRP